MDRISLIPDIAPTCINQENCETRKKPLCHKGFLLFVTPSALSAAASEYHVVANGRDTPDS